MRGCSLGDGKADADAAEGEVAERAGDDETSAAFGDEAEAEAEAEAASDSDATADARAAADGVEAGGTTNRPLLLPFLLLLLDLLLVALPLVPVAVVVLVVLAASLGR